MGGAVSALPGHEARLGAPDDRPRAQPHLGVLRGQFDHPVLAGGQNGVGRGAGCAGAAGGGAGFFFSGVEVAFIFSNPNTVRPGRPEVKRHRRSIFFGLF